MIYGFTALNMRMFHFHSHSLIAFEYMRACVESFFFLVTYLHASFKRIFFCNALSGNVCLYLVFVVAALVDIFICFDSKTMHQTKEKKLMNLSKQKIFMIYSKQIDISTALSLDCVKRTYIYISIFRKWELKKHAHTSYTKHCKSDISLGKWDWKHEQHKKKLSLPLLLLLLGNQNVLCKIRMISISNSIIN